MTFSAQKYCHLAVPNKVLWLGGINCKELLQDNNNEWIFSIEKYSIIMKWGIIWQNLRTIIFTMEQY